MDEVLRAKIGLAVRAAAERRRAENSARDEAEGRRAADLWTALFGTRTMHVNEMVEELRHRAQGGDERALALGTWLLEASRRGEWSSMSVGWAVRRNAARLGVSKLHKRGGGWRQEHLSTREAGGPFGERNGR